MRNRDHRVPFASVESAKLEYGVDPREYGVVKWLDPPGLEAYYLLVADEDSSPHLLPPSARDSRRTPGFVDENALLVTRSRNPITLTRFVEGHLRVPSWEEPVDE